MPVGSPVYSENDLDMHENLKTDEELGVENLTTDSVDDGELEWHDAIMRHNWDAIENMLKCYVHTKFQKKKNSVTLRTRNVHYFHYTEFFMKNNIKFFVIILSSLIILPGCKEKKSKEKVKKVALNTKITRIPAKEIIE